MLVKGIRDEDFTQYKKASMFVAMPHCTFKCEIDNGCSCCQNEPLALAPNIEISSTELVKRYCQNPITKAIVFGGLEPFDDWDDLFECCSEFRAVCDDDIIIYTGYNKQEIEHEKIMMLTQLDGVIIKYGRFIMNDEPRFDPVLGITLVSKNQYAEVL